MNGIRDLLACDSAKNAHSHIQKVATHRAQQPTQKDQKTESVKQIKLFDLYKQLNKNCLIAITESEDKNRHILTKHLVEKLLLSEIIKDCFVYTNDINNYSDPKFLSLFLNKHEDVLINNLQMNNFVGLTKSNILTNLEKHFVNNLCKTTSLIVFDNPTEEQMETIFELNLQVHNVIIIWSFSDNVPPCETKNLLNECDYLFLGKPNSESMKRHKEYYEQLVDISPADFSIIHNELTKNNGYVVLPNDKNNSKLFFYNINDVNTNTVLTLEQHDKEPSTMILNNVEKLDISDIINTKSPTVHIIGKRGTGKTFVIVNILQEMYNNDNTTDFVIFAHDANKHMYIDVGIRIVHNEYNPDILKQIFYRQMLCKKKLVIVLDDCFYDKNDKNIRELMFNGRHHNISTIVGASYPLGFGPEIRTNFDFVMLLKEDIISNKKRLYDYYCGMFPSFDSFIKTFDSSTNDYGTLVIKMHPKEKTLNNYIKTYKAVSSCIKIKSSLIDFRGYIEKDEHTKPTNPTISANEIKLSSYSDDPNDMISSKDFDCEILEEIINCNKKILQLLQKNGKKSKKQLNLMMGILKFNEQIVEGCLKNESDEENFNNIDNL